MIKAFVMMVFLSFTLFADDPLAYVLEHLKEKKITVGLVGLQPFNTGRHRLTQSELEHLDCLRIKFEMALREALFQKKIELRYIQLQNVVLFPSYETNLDQRKLFYERSRRDYLKKIAQENQVDYIITSKYFSGMIQRYFEKKRDDLVISGLLLQRKSGRIQSFYISLKKDTTLMDIKNQLSYKIAELMLEFHFFDKTFQQQFQKKYDVIKKYKDRKKTKKAESQNDLDDASW